MSKAKTKAEVLEEFIDKISSTVDYWSRQPGNKRDAAEGVAFSIMSLLDGCTELPAFDLYPSPCPEDKEDNISEGMDWYESIVINDEVYLHELLPWIKKSGVTVQYDPNGNVVRCNK